VQEGYSLKDKKKEVICLNCNKTFEVGVNSRESIRCPDCAHNKIMCDSSIKILVKCIDCGSESYGLKNRKYCDDCLHLKRSQSGRNSVFSQKENRRSKNETYFAELCVNYFGIDDIKTNEPMFDGWDADIIINSCKVAVLWNGKWHYEKITKQHSVDQVQNRDRIKISKIEEYNYIPYIIKDMGRFNIKFVEREFSSMVECLSHKQNTTDRNR
jgi:hypothetical protein